MPCLTAVLAKSSPGGSGCSGWRCQGSAAQLAMPKWSCSGEFWRKLSHEVLATGATHVMLDGRTEPLKSPFCCSWTSSPHKELGEFKARGNCSGAVGDIRKVPTASVSRACNIHHLPFIHVHGGCEDQNSWQMNVSGILEPRNYSNLLWRWLLLCLTSDPRRKG